jgi:hypothetical protein
MKTFYKIGSAAILIALVITAVLPVSCKKDTTCKAEITVVDAQTNQPLSGATVKLDCHTCNPPGSLQTDQSTTDASGRTSFSFREEAVLDITVSYPNKPNATGVIKLEAGKTATKTIAI